MSDDIDQPLPEDADIRAAHPLKTDRHDFYAEAMRLVGAKRSKRALVELVNWLLAGREDLRGKLAAVEHDAVRLRTERKGIDATKGKLAELWNELDDLADDLDEMGDALADEKVRATLGGIVDRMSVAINSLPESQLERELAEAKEPTAELLNAVAKGSKP